MTVVRELKDEINRLRALIQKMYEHAGHGNDQLVFQMLRDEAEAQITDEMIERALRAFYKHTAVQNFAQVSRDQMRSALEAAL